MDGLAAIRQTAEFEELLRKLDDHITLHKNTVLDNVSKGDMDVARLKSGVVQGLTIASNIFRGK